MEELNNTPQDTSYETQSLPRKKGIKPVFIISGVAALLGVILLFSATKKESVTMKGYDPAVIEGKIKEIEEANLKRQQEILETVKSLKEEIKETKEKKQPKETLSESEKKIIESIQKSITPGTPQQETKPLNLTPLQSIIPQQAPPPRPSITKKEVSLQIATQQKEGVTVEKTSLNSTKQVKKKTYFLPAGTIVEGKLYTGALAPVKNAPSNYESPLVVIGFTKNGITSGFRTFPLKGGVLLAKAEGIWNLQRVVMKAYKIVLITRNGQVIEKKITGQVQGEDGIDGVPGYTVNPDEAKRMITFFGSTAIGGFFAAMAEAQKETYNTAFGTTTRIKDELKYNIAMSLSKSWDNFSQWYLEQIKQAMPFVVAEPGKKVYFVVQDGIEIEEI
jgi:hypothetical protein